MIYVNQLEYENIPYATDIRTPDDEVMHKGNIKMAGCGICSSMMLVDQLTEASLSMDECIQMSYDKAANMAPGTDMRKLGPAVAEKYGLTYDVSDDPQEAAKALHEGGRVIVNVGGDRDGKKGVFCKVGHFMLLISEKNGEFCILDPSQSEEKYSCPEAKEMGIHISGHCVYAPIEAVEWAASIRSPRYYIFGRK